MNRNQRRKIASDKITSDELKAIESELIHQANANAVRGVLASLQITLHDKWGWGEVRLNRLTEQINEQFDAVVKGYVTLTDLEQAVREIGGKK